MDGYSLAEKLRKARRRYRLTAAEQGLFHELIAVCNEEEWPDVFMCSNIDLCAALNTSEKTLIEWRQSLINAGLVNFKSGKNKREASTYSLNGTELGNTIDLPNGCKNSSRLVNQKLKKALDNLLNSSPIDCNNSSQSASQLEGTEPISLQNDCKNYNHSNQNTSDIYKGKTKTKLNELKKYIERAEGKIESDEVLPWEKSKHDEDIPPVAAAPLLSGFELIRDECMKAVSWQLSLSKSLGLKNLEETSSWLTKYFEMLEGKDDTQRDLKETRIYAFNWIKAELTKVQSETKPKEIPVKQMGKAAQIVSSNQAVKKMFEERRKNEQSASVG